MKSIQMSRKNMFICGYRYDNFTPTDNRHNTQYAHNTLILITGPLPLTTGVCKYYIGTIGLKYYIGPSAVFLC